jgi:branched-subunit amino acid aminotransferase/4-amino-4-deoxychorismate lyase
MDAPWAYRNGEWIESAALCVAVDDVGFLLGATVTERFRTFRGEVFRLDEHLARMRHSLEIVSLAAGEIVAELGRAVPEFVRRNQSHLAADDDWSIVAFVTPGPMDAAQPTVCVHGHRLPFGRWAAQYEDGLAVVVSDVRQVPENCWPPELKCRSRMHYYLADRRAAASQAGARAILLDQEGYIGEATTANVVIYRVGEGLLSPPADHILAGVSLGVMRELSAAIGVPFVMRRLSVDELQSADEAMLTSTSICLLPIVTCDGRPIGTARPGAIYRRLLAAWNELVGLDVAEQARGRANQHS